MTKRVPRRISSRRPVLTGGYLGACLAVLFAGTAAAQDSRSESFNLYGVPGLVDIPSAGVMP
ncbi:MAG: hypothetical protein ACLFP0_11380, partial [Rhodosalinus sp.]